MATESCERATSTHAWDSQRVLFRHVALTAPVWAIYSPSSYAPAECRDGLTYQPVCRLYSYLRKSSDNGLVTV